MVRGRVSEGWVGGGINFVRSPCQVPYLSWLLMQLQIVLPREQCKCCCVVTVCTAYQECYACTTFNFKSSRPCCLDAVCAALWTGAVTALQSRGTCHTQPVYTALTAFLPYLLVCGQEQSPQQSSGALATPKHAHPTAAASEGEDNAPAPTQCMLLRCVRVPVVRVRVCVCVCVRACVCVCAHARTCTCTYMSTGA
eukprot:1157501-Pelagomonas_calceolata.AAC.3